MRTNVGKKMRMIDFFKKYYLIKFVAGNWWRLTGNTYPNRQVWYFAK